MLLSSLAVCVLRTISPSEQSGFNLRQGHRRLLAAFRDHLPELARFFKMQVLFVLEPQADNEDHGLPFSGNQNALVLRRLHDLLGVLLQLFKSRFFS